MLNSHFTKNTDPSGRQGVGAESNNASNALDVAATTPLEFPTI
jgi:hypothetical protein